MFVMCIGRTSQQLLTTLLAISCFLTITSCSKQSSPPPEQLSGFLNAGNQALDQFVVEANKLNALTAQLILEQQTNALDKQQLDDIRSQWIRAHHSWHQASLYLRLLPLLDQHQATAKLANNLHSHPFQPGYIDSVSSHPDSGLINDTTTAITIESLRTQHNLWHLESSTLGLHPLEFLLWGEQQNRTADDFNTNNKNPNTSPSYRRKQYLQNASNILLSDAKNLATQWRELTPELTVNINSNQPLILALLEDEISELVTQFNEEKNHSHWSADTGWQNASLQTINQWLINFDKEPIASSSSDNNSNNGPADATSPAE